MLQAEDGKRVGHHCLQDEFGNKDLLLLSKGGEEARKSQEVDVGEGRVSQDDLESFERC